MDPLLPFWSLVAGRGLPAPAPAGLAGRRGPALGSQAGPGSAPARVPERGLCGRGRSTCSGDHRRQQREKPSLSSRTRLPMAGSRPAPSRGRSAPSRTHLAPGPRRRKLSESRRRGGAGCRRAERLAPLSRPVLSVQVCFCPGKTSSAAASLCSCYCRSSWLPLKQESFFILLATVTV